MWIVKDEINNIETENIYGYVIEFKSNFELDEYWENYWNSKIYKSLDVAKEALDNIKKCGYFTDLSDFRIRYLYYR